MKDVLIIGAGMSGLMAARQLERAGRTVTVVDKGRSVGGRMATRYVGPGFADHGAQFFTVREERFGQDVEQWLAEDVVYVWGRGWSDGSVLDTQPDGHPRYAVRGGMNQLTKRLRADLAETEVHVGVRVIVATPTSEGWAVTDEAGATYAARALIMTPPVPQSLAILEGVGLTPSDRAALGRLEYGPCLCGLFWLKGELTLPEPGAVQRPDAEISWIADNRAKGISPDALIVTVHASPAWSAAHFAEADPEPTLDALFAPLTEFAAGPLTVVERQLKKWRYSVPQVTHPERTLIADALPPLVFAGDAFGGPRVEGAVMSGLAAAEALTE